jgi:hypothetical protein
MSDIETVEYHQYCPPGVQRVIASGTSAWISVVDESTALKYALQPGGDTSRLEMEYKILTIVSEHPHVIRLKSFSEVRLYLERAVNGTLYKYLAETDHPTISIQQRLLWCRELTLAVVHVHSR